MKRVLPGTKRKKAKPALRPAAKRPSVRAKSEPAKSAQKKSSSVKKVQSLAAKVKVAKSRIARKKSAQRQIAQSRSNKAKKSSGDKVSALLKSKRSVTAPHKTVKKVGVRKKTALLSTPKGPLVSLARLSSLAPETSAVVAKVSPKVVRKVNRKTIRKSEFTLPAFLLEGDEPIYPVTGSGEKFVLGPTPPLDHFDEAKVPLPDSYGTGRLFLTARDPHWLYAHWDFTMQEQFRYNAQSVDRHMILRLHDAAQPGAHISEIHVHPESRHWFTHVDAAGKKYIAEIGYYQAGRKWKSLATSEPQCTPPDNISPDSTIEFATIPLELPFETMLALLKEQSPESVGQNVPLARGIEQIRARAQEYFPHTPSATGWTLEQENALAQILAASRTGAALSGSGEFIAEKEFSEFSFDVEAGEVAPITSSSSYVSSFFGGEAQKDFWFNVNAELIVYGATEPNATVTLAGKKIPLRADGTFRFRFALPDGQYELPVTAVSADGTDGRAAELKFTRATEIRGAVAAAPQDPALSPPPAESV